MLFAKGFSEANQKYGHFFRQATEQTAFVINFEDDDEIEFPSNYMKKRFDN